ncbi:sn-glycerol-3-phosphate ABC transporter ATP-binding protein UgpC [Mesorhizobium sp. BR1-1-16]|uniref:ABC transporter ATP-binding protein n=1 Tax=Mesorhizobium sp. BR1-1-16 TaxID=2876653 RepID=UPI001CC96871|nr:sn-glycerol-3-phosphate ABC transporter ATP-binding protein UgpC [Mesorhizobium sp. BR1-1-16]MBZ9938603.1 sn-glycerol-3-phosphate ABC transporter ATP-binding protein UgpC [Mesorhizobium sp. BR1-1-16]
MASVSLEGLTKSYGNGVLKAVNDLNLEIEDGEFVVLVGPSGCGKSTALRMIAGLEEISDGGVWIGDQFVNDVHPKDRDVAMVFQNYALYPHMTVFDNIAFALQIAGMPRDEIRRRVEDAARTLELTDYLKRRPGQLSGGQRQRVAMGRAIVRQPAVFLMDEPLSNLDAKLRVQMRAEISKLQRRLGVTTIYVTHDQVEAMTMGDRVALLRDGNLQQVAPPSVMYDEPANMFVAAFLGSPSMNLLWGELGEVSASGTTLKLGGQTLLLTTEKIAGLRRLGAYANRAVVVGIRPEDIYPAADRPGATSKIRSNIDLVEALGSDKVLHFSIDARQALVKSSDSLDELNHGEAGKAHCVARLNARTPLRMGDDVDLVFDTDRLHFFDGETGEAIR